MSETNGKRTLLDDLVDGAREILDALERLVNPEKRRRQAPVPIPVRVNPPHPQDLRRR